MSESEAGEVPQPDASENAEPRAIFRRPLLLLPLAGVVVIGGSFLALLDRARRGRYNPHEVPNLLVGHPVPTFALAPSAGGPGFSSADLAHLAAPVLINFFASWCVPCHAENPLLMRLQSRGVRVWGIAYEDQPQALRNFFVQNGDPFARVGADAHGQAAVAWGISGVPESFLVDRHGMVRWHIGGPLSPAIVADTLDPLLRKYS